MTETTQPLPPNPLAVRYVAGRGYFVWSSFQEKAISKDFLDEREAGQALAKLSHPIWKS